jgi:metallophosphoesterase (TIGR00282 family)
MGAPGRMVVSKVLPKIKIQYDIDIVIAQAENVTHGKGISKKHYLELLESGVDAFSGGNHTFERTDTMKLVQDVTKPIIAPVNSTLNIGPKFKTITSKSGYSVSFVSLLGYTIPVGYDTNTLNPLEYISDILPEIDKQEPQSIIVNFHGDLSSEKVMVGHYLDGKVTAVIGDHWHVPSADARLLPNSTAHVTDVGMCGALNSSLGIKADLMINRWLGNKVKNELETNPPFQFNAMLIKTNNESIQATGIERIQEYIY